jgi:glycosyltransferase involved in cell wall biosynthesis
MKILLLTDIPPCTNYTGGIVLDQLCRLLPHGSIVCFCVLDKHNNPIISRDLAWIPIIYHKKPKEYWPYINYGIGKTVGLIGETYNELVNKQKIIKRAVQYGKNNSVDRVWAILEGQTMIRIALPVANKLKVPLFTEVWDPPVWAMRVGRVDKVSKKYLFQQYDETIKNSQACATASWEMKEEYKKKYHIKTIAFLPSLDSQIKPGINKSKKINENKKDFIIGIAGQLYAHDAWNALLKTLEINNWKISNKHVKIILLGRNFTLGTNNKINIEYKGWYSQKETINLLNSCNVLYCPYWFSKEYEQEARLSFPSKLVSYMAANKPIFFHGPAYASPARFLEREKAGYCCYSLNPNEIYWGLKKINTNVLLRKKLVENGKKALEKYFTLENLHGNFKDFFHTNKK